MAGASKDDDQGGPTFDLPEASRRELEAQEQRIAEFELRRKVRMTVVPTDDAKVRQMLRQLGEPVTLFGEREMERRERLRKLVAERQGEGLPLPLVGQLVVQEKAPVQREVFFTEGPEGLKAARLDMARWSLVRARDRIREAKRRKENDIARQEDVMRRDAALRDARLLAQQCSEMGDDRPISACRFAPQGSTLATCGWSGMVRLWALPSCAKLCEWRAHDERATDIAWHPHARALQQGGADVDGHVGNGDARDGEAKEGGADGGGPEAMDSDEGGESLSLMTGGVDGLARLWSATGKLLHTLEGHTDRLGRIAMHPMGRHAATSSFDTTWRLWDLETGQCVVEQEGHSRAVYAVAFHPDGSLALSVGMDAIGRLWDCRTGRSLTVLSGHVKPVLAVDFSPDGVHAATGSEDHAARIWDLRQRKCSYTLPAHRSLVSAVRFERHSGAHLLTAGYDNVAKVWSVRDHSLLKILAGHEGKVMGADLAPGDEQLVATVSYDRTIKLWAPEYLPDVIEE